MGLDIHVMRPRRFFLRDYELPAQRLLPGVEIRVIGAEPMSAFDAGVAEDAVIKQVRWNQNDPRYVLPEDDGIYYSEKFNYAQFDLLREFAAFFDYPQKRYLFWGDRGFGEGYDLDALPSIKAAWRRQQSRYPHLVFHEDNRGFYCPTALAKPMPTEFSYIGSTFRLQEELERLAPKARLAGDHQETIAGAIDLLRQAAEASVNSRLPIIFDG